MAKMSIARSHVLNYELYKILVMKVDKLCSTAVGPEDTDELHLENKILRSRLALVEEARHQAKFKATKVETMRKVCNDAQRRDELKLKVYENMAYIKRKYLDEAQAELSKSNELLDRLGV
ncbi:hypothetical protein Fot_19658 [Forsythia ovata]|uniref:Uncharacterized protein n=1 Tax=Forsythia ovata TaxID=205694 RepID=A0ABD1VM13_9LAMI